MSSSETVNSQFQAHRTTTTPEISVVICTYNRSGLLRKALLSFGDVNPVPSAEIVVVDNNSTDDTHDVVNECTEQIKNRFPIRYVREAVQGLSAARNTGVAASRGGIVAFLDDDAIPSKMWLAGMKEFFDHHPQAMAAGGPIEPNFETSAPDWMRKEFEGPYSILELGEKIIEFPRNALPFGASIAFRREILERHPFPHELGRKGNLLISGEEIWVLKKVMAEGGKIFYLPDLRVKHFVPKERLNKEWMRARFYAGGISKVLAADSAHKAAALIPITLVKFTYLILQKCLPLTPGGRFLNECRLRSCAGVVHGLKERYGRNRAGD